MDDEFLINIEVADKSYGIWIDREDEEVVREAARQIRMQILRYRHHYDKSEVSIKDLLAMIAVQLSIENLQLEARNDTAPFTEKIRKLTEFVESYLTEGK